MIKKFSLLKNIIKKNVPAARRFFSCLLFLSLILPVAAALADDIEAVLGDTNGVDAFVVQDSTGVAFPVASIDSDGNFRLRGCFRLGSSYQECTAANQLIVDGNVGIRQTAPAYEFDVTGTGRLTGSLRMGTAAGTRLGTDNSIYPHASSGYLNLLGGAGNAIISIGDSTIHMATGNGAEKVTIDANGNLGVNSTVPGSRLDVVGGVSRILNGTTAPSPYRIAMPAGSLYVQEDLQVDGNVYLGDASTDNLTVAGSLTLVGGANTQYTGPLRISVDDNYALRVMRGNGLTDVFYVDTVDLETVTMGNVGIGTSSPVAGLQVGTGAPTKAGVFTLAASDALVRGNLEVDDTLYGVDAQFSGDTTIGGNLVVTGTLSAPIALTGDLHMGDIPYSMNGGLNGLLFNPNNLGTANIVISAGGNIGIGSTQPGAGIVVGTGSGAGVASSRTDVYIQRNLEVDNILYATNVGVGSSSPAQRLDVAGGAYVSGNVGIGSSAPGAKLDVDGGVYIWTRSGTVNYARQSGDLYVEGTLEVDGNVYLGDAVTDNLTVVGALNLEGDTAYTGPVSISTTDVSAFSIKNTGGGITYFNVDTSTGTGLSHFVGNVGINTTTPRGNLEITRSPGSVEPFLISSSTSQNGDYLTVTSSGNMGISSTNPQQKLDVEGGVYFGNGNVGIGTAAAANWLAVGPSSQFQVNSAGAIAASTGIATSGGYTQSGTGANTFTGTATFSNATNSALFTGGNVGIGTTDPQAKLVVDGGVYVWTGTGVVNYARQSGDLYVERDFEVDGNVYLGDASTDNLTVLGTLNLSGTTSYNGPITITTDDVSALLVRKNNLSQVLNVDTSGSGAITMATTLGIGAASAGAALSVGSGSDAFATGAGDVYIQRHLAVPTDAKIGNIQASANTIEATNNSGLNFFDNASLGLTIADGGNVGIGSTAPGARLVVDGGVYIWNSSGTVNYARQAGDLYIENTLEVDGNVYLGDAVTDNLTVVGALNLAGDTTYTGPVSIATTNTGAFSVKNAGGGTTYFNIDTSTGSGLSHFLGNVGINTTTPQGNLEITRSPGTAAPLMVSSSTIANGDYLMVTSAGNMGIGTTQPAAKLHVGDGDLLLDNTRSISVRNAAGTARSIITMTAADKVELLGSSNENLYLAGGAGTVTVGANADAASRLGVSGNASVGTGFLSSAGPTNGLIVQGNVGIGSATPQQKLDVEGTVYFGSGNVGIGSAQPGAKLVVDGGVYIWSSSGTVNYARQTGDLYVEGTLEVDGNVYLGDAVTDNLTVVGALNLAGDTNYTGPVSISTTNTGALSVKNAGGLTTYFNVDTSTGSGLSHFLGNVGINTTTPQGNLEITRSPGSVAPLMVSSATTENGDFLIVTSAGNIGINSATPQQKLDVEGSVYFGSGNVGIGSAQPGAKLVVDGGVYIWSGSGTVDYARNSGDLYIENTLEVDGNVYLGDAVTDNLTVVGALNLAGDTNYTGPVSISTTDTSAFSVSNAGGVTTYFNVDTSTGSGLSHFLGNVGINTTTPQGNLEITRSPGSVAPLMVSSATTENGDFLIVTSAGNIGINSATPQQKLDVEGSVYFGGGNLGIGSSTTAARLDVNGTIYGHGNVGIGTATARALLDVEGAVYLRGNVGVGSVSPEATLDVGGDIRTSSGFLTSTQTTFSIRTNGASFDTATFLGSQLRLGTALNDRGELRLYADTGATPQVPVISLQDETGAVAGYLHPDNDGNLRWGASDPGEDDVANPKVVVEDASGNVGIGSATPQQKLDVEGTVYIGTGNLGIGTPQPGAKLVVDGGVYIWDGNGTVNHATHAGDLYVHNTLEVDGNVYLGDAIADNLTVAGSLSLAGNTDYTGPVSISTTDVNAFSVSSTGGGTTFFNIDTSTGNGLSHFLGNVGINTTTPQGNLEITRSPGTAAPFMVSSATTANGDYLVVTSAGNVGIASAAPRQKLDVEGSVYIGTGNVGIGSALPQQRLDVEGSIYVGSAGNIGIATSSPVAGLQVGSGSSALNAALDGTGALIIGNLEVDGKIYGDGSGLTGVPGSIAGLTTNYVAKAASASTLADSQIFDNGTNVGIGSAAPQQKLDVEGSVYFGSGNVGIGVAAPLERLHVVGALAGDFIALFAESGITPESSAVAANSGQMLSVQGDGGAYFMGRDVTNNIEYIMGTSTQGAAFAGSMTAHDFQLRTNNATRVTIRSSSGNVGVGTTAPRQLLDVEGAVYMRGNVGIGTVSSETSMQIVGGDGTEIAVSATGDGQQSRFGFYESSDLKDGFRVQYDGAVNALKIFARDTYVDYQSRGMTILRSSGNVGIGSVSPGAKLDVDGGVYIWDSGTGVVNYARDTGDLYVQGTLEVDGNVYIGDAVADNLTVAGSLNLAGDTSYTGPVSISTTDVNAFSVSNTGSGTTYFNVDTSTGTGISNFVGNVGINTTTPQGNLEITRSPGTVAPLVVSSATTQNGDYLVVASNGNVGIGSAAPQQKLDVEGAVYFGSGNVGIGSAAPQARLDVEGTVYFGNGNVGVGSASPVAALDVRAASVSGTRETLWRASVSDAARDFLALSNATASDSQFYPSFFGAKESDTRAGLDFRGATNASNDTGSNPLVLFEAMLYPDASADPVNAGYSNPSVRPLFGFNNATTNYMLIASSGNVGVNTASPAARLDVNGTIYGHNNVGIGTATARQLLDVDGAVYLKGNVGIGTTAPGVAGLQVGSGSSSLNATLGSTAALIKGNLEVDGKIYGDGSGLTNLTGAIAGLTTNAVPKASSSSTLTDSGMYAVSGNVGVGSTTPQAKLDVEGTVYFGGGNVGIGSAMPEASLDVNGTIYGHGNVGIGTAAARVLLDVEGAVYMRGSVGIGTLSSTAALEVKGGMAGSTVKTGIKIPTFDATGSSEAYGIYIDEPTGATNTYGIRIRGGSDDIQLVDGSVKTSGGFINNNSVNNSAFRTGNSGAGIERNIADTNPALYVRQINAGSTGDILQLRNDSSTVAVVSQGGNVGIGTTAPIQKLEVDGNVYVTGGNVGIGTWTPSLAGLQVGSGTSSLNATLGSTAALIKGNLEVDGMIYGDGSGLTNVSGSVSGLTSNYLPKAASATSLANSQIFDNGTNVGIGSTTPQAKLDVEGTVYFGGGNVGIGTPQPRTLLEVDGMIYGNTIGIGTTSSSYSLNVIGMSAAEFRAAATWAGFRISLGSSGTSLSAVEGSSAGAGALSLRTSTNTFDGAVRLYISEEGNVGIATTEPLAKLQVDGALYTGTTAPSHSGVSLGSAGDAMFGGDVEIDGALYVDSGIYFTGPLVGDGSHLTGVSSSQWSGAVGSDIYYNSANVGIGSSSPQQKLDVEGTVYFGSGNVGIGSVTPAAGLDVNGTIYGHGNVGIGTAAARALLDVEGAVYMRGNVGIGTTTPSSLLTVGPGTDMPSYTPDVYITGTTSSNLLLRDSTSDTELRVSTANGAGFLGTVSNSDLTIRTANADRLTVLSSGNVGIGIASPRQLLDVDGAVYMSGNVGIGTTDPSANLEVDRSENIGASDQLRVLSRIRLRDSIGGTFYQNMGAGLAFSLVAPTGTAMDAAVIYGQNPVGMDTTQGLLAFHTLTSGSMSEKMRIIQTGNVGIGTTAPVAKLHVDGAIYAAAGAVPTHAGVSLGSAGDAMFGGDVEIDGALYVDSGIYFTGPLVGDGSHLTGISSSQWSGTAGSDIYYNSANVGIGSSSPQQKLDVEGTVYFGTGNVGIGSATPAASLDVNGTIYGHGNVGIGTSEARALLDVEGAVYMRGNVGIGTANPGAMLSLYNSQTAPAWDSPMGIEVAATGGTWGMPFTVKVDGDRIFSISNNGNVYGRYLQIWQEGAGIEDGMELYNHNTGSAAGTRMLFTGTDATWNYVTIASIQAGKTQNTIGDVEGYLSFSTIDNSTSTERMRVNSLGNLGVGTTAPVAKLQVDGAIYAAAGAVPSHSGVSLGAAGDAMFGGDVEIDGALYVDSGIYFTGSLVGDGSQLSGIASTGSLTQNYLTKMGASSLSNSQIFDNGTNIGIGSSTPQQKLDVEGTVYFGTGNVGIGSATPTASLDVNGTIYGHSNVGIGTATARAMLDVEGAVYIRGSLGIDAINPSNRFQINASNYPSVTRFSVANSGATDIYIADASSENFDVHYASYSVLSANWQSLTLNTWSADQPYTIQTGEQATSLSLINTRNYSLIFGTNNSERARIDADGNFGIGTSVPMAKLHVDGAIYAAAGAVPTHAGVSLGAAGDAMFGGDVEIDGALYVDSGIYFTGPLVGDGSGLTNLSSASQWSGTAGSAIYYNSANVGIGSSTPQQKLDVEGTVYFGTGNVGIGSATPTASLDVNGTIYGHGNVGIGTSAARALLDVDGAVYMKGNLGIGSTSPAAKLDVNGKMQSTQLTLNQSAVDVFNVFFANNTGGNRPGLVFNRGRGTIAVPTTTSNSDWMGQLRFNGYNGIAYQGLYEMIVMQDSAWDIDGRADSKVNFQYMTPANAGTSTTMQSFSSNGNAYFAGNVGIGSSSPQQKLDVEGTVYFGAGNVGIGSATPTASLDVNGTIYGHGNVGIGTSAARALLDVEGAVYMRGNVGIGTSAISQALEVNGNTFLYGNLSIASTAPWAASTWVNGTTTTITGTRNYISLRENVSVYSTLAIAANNYANDLGTAALYVNGNVGIGATSPQARLDVEGGVYFGSGNVGIGSALPGAKLEVDGAIYAAAGAAPSHSGVSLGAAGDAMFGGDVEIDGALYVDSGIYFTGPLVGDGSGLTNLSSASQWSGTAGSAIYYNSANVGIGSSAPQQKLDVEGSVYFGSGNVGIGSAAPADLLDIYSDVDSMALANITNPNNGSSAVAGYYFSSDTASGGFTAQGSNYAAYPNLAGRVMFGVSAGSGFDIATLPGGSDIRFYAGGLTTSYERMRITSSGNIGIGSATPQQHLDVEGTVYFGTGNVGIGSVTPTAKLDVNGTIYGHGNVGIGTSAARALLDVEGAVYLRGNVGIGTAIPTNTFAVHGDMDISGIIRDEGGGGYIELTDYNVDLRASGGGVIDISDGPLRMNGYAITTYNTNLVLAPDTGFHTVITSGNVGIGTTSPHQHLEVDGNVYVTGGNVGIGTWIPAAAGLQVGSGSSSLNATLGSTSALIKGNLEVDGKIYGDGSALTGITATGSVTWSDVTGTSQSMAVNHGYISDNASRVTLTLPATASVGDIIQVAGGVSGTGGWRIAQNAGQTIHFGSVSTTTGTGGYLQSVGQYDSVQLLCVQADTVFVVITSVGNITYN